MLSHSHKRPRSSSEAQVNVAAAVNAESAVASESHVDKKPRSIGPQVYRPIRAERQKQLQQLQAKASNLKTILKNQQKLVLEAQKKADELKKLANAAEEQMRVAMASQEKTQEDLKNLSTETEALSDQVAFMAASRPGSDMNRWFSLSRQVPSYCRKKDNAKLVMKDVLKGLALLEKAEETCSVPKMFFNSPLLELIGSGNLKMSEELLAMDDMLDECLLYQNVLLALKEEYISANIIINQLQQFSSLLKKEEDILNKIELATSYNNRFKQLFDKGLNLIKIGLITAEVMQQYFESQAPEEFLKELIRKSTESLSYKPNLPMATYEEARISATP